MFRTSSLNSAGTLVGITMALSVAAASLSACGVNVHSAGVRGTGYVRLDEAVKRHPLYSQLSQLDDAIAAITLQSARPAVPLGARQIAAQTGELNRELRAAQDRANKILAAKQRSYMQREQQAVAAALAAAGVPGAGALAAAQMSGASAVQAQQAARAADVDLQAYRQNVIAQDSAATSSIANQLQTQAAQKFRAKAEQLQQNETDLSLKLTQRDAGARLAIKMRLSNLAMDATARQQAQSQLAAINARETEQVTAARKSDEATLRAYRAQLSRETGDAVRAQAGAISAQTRAKLEERRDEVGSQVRGLAPVAPPANLSPKVQGQIAQLHRQYTGAFQADARKTIAEYDATKSDLDRQFAALHGADVGATGAAGKELDSLQKRRGELYQQIVGQVERDAARVAKNRGLSIVFVNVWAAAGGYDMTGQVINDVESQHE